jgi:hypothetical protein
MPTRRVLQTLVLALSLLVISKWSAHADDAGTVAVDANPLLVNTGIPSPPPGDASSSAIGSGSGSSTSGSGSAVTTPAATAPATDVPPDTESLLKSAYKAITTKNWFLLAGVALAFVTIGVRWLLKKKWPSFEKDRWGVALVAALAGIGGLSHAWLADAPVVSELTLIGAVKVFAAAVMAYVTSKKLFMPSDAPTVS